MDPNGNITIKWGFMTSNENTYTTEHGDIFDCVPIYKQPALDHPLLRDHVIQMKATSMSKWNGTNHSSTHVKNVFGFEGCPVGSVPIRRTLKEDILRLSTFGKKSTGNHLKHVFRAGLYTRWNTGTYYGAKAFLNTWNPYVPKSDQYSSASVIVNDDQCVIQAGWAVFQDLFGDTRTRLYAYWTVNPYELLLMAS
ncbi:hypothetical protein Cni_G14618 [Canna indica]|uniref:Neprosin PEP catalytic domain-containing protein n=1 Tax=Canna indica TaxID=4628 RepID=A0AAQ3KCF2_9LILI|nr:hypothetical protein Cni_G14618 [Canna indica]